MAKNPLGEKSQYPDRYDPSLLYPIPRWPARSLLDIEKKIRMYGVDHWHAYELSWLDADHRPRVAIAEFFFNSDSEHIVESKSLKLYLNSLYNECYKDEATLIDLLVSDLSRISMSEVKVVLRAVDEMVQQLERRTGRSIDSAQLGKFGDAPDALLLRTGGAAVEDEVLFSDLFRSNCPVTGQPDWASVEVRYTGSRIDEGSLLTYLCSYRQHQGYHEECAERIFRDILLQCQPAELRVGLNFLRRGGIDINVYRSTVPVTSDTVSERLARQ